MNQVMSVTSLNFCSLASTALLAAALLSPAHAAVVPVDQLAAGKSYGQWLALRSKWALEIPWDGHHPYQDRTGADVLRNQSGPVLYLYGSSNPTTRTIAVPDDRMLFVEILGNNCSTVEAPPFYGRDEAELRACVESFREADLFLEIDGVTVPNLESYHVVSPLFDFVLPANNIDGVPGGGPGQGVAAAVGVILEPLSPGSHTIRFYGRYPDFNYTANVTYQIAVYARPAITIRPVPSTNLLELSWPSTSGFLLQQADSLSAAATWTSVSGSATTNGVSRYAVSPSHS